MPTAIPLLSGAFPAGEGDEFSDTGRRPVIFDILGPDHETSVLPEGMRLVLHVNPTSMAIKYTRIIERIQTKGGWVEQHFGDGTTTIDFDHASGGFMRLYSGLSNVTSPGSVGGSRRETLAYDSYLDLLALFHNNASIYDEKGQVALQGIIKITFDGGIYLGWFNSFTVTDSADLPYQFNMTSSFEVHEEVQAWKTTMSLPSTLGESGSSPVPPTANPPMGDNPVESPASASSSTSNITGAGLG